MSDLIDETAEAEDFWTGLHQLATEMADIRGVPTLHTKINLARDDWTGFTAATLSKDLLWCSRLLGGIVEGAVLAPVAAEYGAAVGVIARAAAAAAPRTGPLSEPERRQAECVIVPARPVSLATYGLRRT